MSEQSLIGDHAVGERLPRQPPERLGDIVVRLGYCDRDAVEAAVAAAAVSGELLGQVLLERGALTTDQLAMAMAKRFGLEHRNLADITLDEAAVALVSFTAARRMGAVPVAVARDHALEVAIANPENFLALAVLGGLLYGAAGTRRNRETQPADGAPAASASPRKQRTRTRRVMMWALRRAVLRLT